MRAERRWVWGLAAAVVVAVATLSLQTARQAEAPRAAEHAPTPSVRADSSGWSLLALGGGGDAPAGEAPQGRPPREPEDLLQALFTDGSLRGAALDGGWGTWNGQQLTPSRDLRRRFDQLLTTLGEASADELRPLVGWLAERDLGPSGALAVLAVWDRYLQLQQHAYREVMDLHNPARWPQVLHERQQARRNRLGPGWAEAFYSEEERAFSQRLQATPGPANPPAPDWVNPAPAGIPAPDWQRQRVTALGAEAAERLQAEEQRQAEWAARLEAARAALDGIARAPELSATQRQAAAAQWLNQHFEGNERLRASVLLGL